jgi:hypothetical protein
MQNDCPLARVVYCSATDASSLENMAYMQRLGLWGENTAFADFNAFKSSVADGGAAVPPSHERWHWAATDPRLVPMPRTAYAFAFVFPNRNLLPPSQAWAPWSSLPWI